MANTISDCSSLSRSRSPSLRGTISHPTHSLPPLGRLFSFLFCKRGAGSMPPCRMLGLPDPTSDELGRPVWPCSAADVSRAYRRLSVTVHPDKNPGEDARRAFEALNQAHRILKDPAERVGVSSMYLIGDFTRPFAPATRSAHGIARDGSVHTSFTACCVSLRRSCGPRSRQSCSRLLCGHADCSCVRKMCAWEIHKKRMSRT